MPHARAVAPEVLWPSPAQRWEPAEILKALRPCPVHARHPAQAAGFPTGKTFALLDGTASSVPTPAQQALRTLEQIHSKENLVVCGPSETAWPSAGGGGCTSPQIPRRPGRRPGRRSVRGMSARISSF